MFYKLALIGVIAAYFSFWKIPKEWEGLEFKAFEFKPAPPFTGPLATNDVLSKAEKLFVDEVNGPESILIEGDTIYVTSINEIIKIVNGKIVKRVYVTKTKNCFLNPKPACGQPLGLRRLTKDLLIFADSAFGLVTLDFDKEEFKILVHNGKKYDGRWVSFVDDVDVIDEDTVVFTDLSWLHGADNMVQGMFGVLSAGRVYKYNIKSDILTLLMDNLYAANGIQLMPDKKSFVVCETMVARIHRYWLEGPKKGQSEIFMDNLPGHPDNLRLSSDKKSLWIALALARVPGKFSILEFFLARPNLRKYLHNYFPFKLVGGFLENMHDPNAYGLAIQADLNGKILKSFHSPNGTVNDLSQLSDDGKYIYLGSYFNKYLGRMKM